MKIEFWGHRGSQTDNELSRNYDRPGHPAENTLAGIAHALDSGADGTEIDVMRTSDSNSSGLSSGQRLVVTHTNESAQHVFGLDGRPESHGYISDMTLAEVKELRVGPQRNGLIPTLAEVLQLISSYSSRAPTLNIEIKDAKDTRFPDLAKSDVIDLVLETLRTSPLSRRQIVVSSFNMDDLKRIEAERTGVRLGMLFFGTSSDPKPIYPANPEVAKYTAFTIENVARALREVRSLSSVHPEMNDIDPSPAMLTYLAANDLALNPWFLREPRVEDHWPQVQKLLGRASLCGIEHMAVISNFAGDIKSLFEQPNRLRFSRPDSRYNASPSH